MNPASLHALVIDRHFGELTPEMAELLDHHLAQTPDARAEADRILAALGVTRNAMYDHPELARVPAPSKTESQVPRRSVLAPWFARAAAILLFASLTATCGYLAGRSAAPSSARSSIAVSPVPAPAPAAPRKTSPWARYRMTFDASGSGMQVVRVDLPTPDKNSIK